MTGPDARQLTPPLDDDAVQWFGTKRDGDIIVLLHGYGADEHDLTALVPHLPNRVTYAAVRAPLAMPWPSAGASWYPVDSLTQRDPIRVTDGAKRFVEWVERSLPDARRIGLVGFSQGGAIALQALRLQPEKFTFVANLSGYAATGDLLGDATLTETKPPVFWGRGALDQVIPEALIVHTTDWLPHHATLTGRIYEGLAHGISAAELPDLRDFVDRSLAPM